MIVLNTANRSLQLLLGGAITTNQLPFVVNYVSTTRERQEHNNSANGLSNSATAVTVLGAPPAGVKRTVQSFSVFNADTVNATATVRLNDNATLRNIVVVTLNTGDHLIYTTASGWFVLSASGFIKSTSTAVNLDDLGDVQITAPAIGATLIYNGTNWIDGALDLADADARTGILPLANGGTNANLTASVGGIFYSTASAGAILAGTATAGQIVRSGLSAAPSWSTATYPATITANRLLYGSALNAVSETGTGLTFDGTTLTANTLTVSTGALTVNGGVLTIDASGGTNQADLNIIAGNGITNRAARIDFFNVVASPTIPRWTLLNDFNQNGTNDFNVVNAAISQVFTILQSGNVGIGMTNPAAKLAVTQSAGGVFTAVFTGNVADATIKLTDGFNDFEWGSTAGSNGFFGMVSNHNLNFRTNNVNVLSLLSGGNVGIGTTSPFSKLVVSGVGQSSVNFDTAVNLGATLYLDDTSGSVGNGGAVMFGTQSFRFAAIKGYIQSGTINGIGDLTFSTRNTVSDSTLTERMRIQYTGNVGIGTAAPGSKLDVTTAALGTTQTTSSGLALVNTTAATALAPVQISPAIRWSGLGWKTDVTAASQAVDFRSYVVPVQGAANPTGYLSFGSSVNGAAYSDGQMVLTTTGNVGIGTTTPLAKLAINGGLHVGGDSDPGDNNALIDGTLTVSGAGPHAIGGSTSANRQLSLTGAFNSQYGLFLSTTLTPGVGNNSIGALVNPVFVEAASGTHVLFAGLNINPSITAGAASVTDFNGLVVQVLTAQTGTTNASAIKIEGAPSGATNNYAVWVAGGTSRFDGPIIGSAAGTLRMSDGARIGADSTNNLLDDTSNGAGTADLYIGNSKILVTGNAATQAEQEAASSITVVTTPGRQHFHPSASKVWVKFNSAGTVAASYNITSITDSGVGLWQVTFNTDFSSVNYCGLAFGGKGNVAFRCFNLDVAAAAGTFDLQCRDSANALADPVTDEIYAVFFGDQA